MVVHSIQQAICTVAIMSEALNFLILIKAMWVLLLMEDDAFCFIKSGTSEIVERISQFFLEFIITVVIFTIHLIEHNQFHHITTL